MDCVAFASRERSNILNLFYKEVEGTQAISISEFKINRYLHPLLVGGDFRHAPNCAAAGGRLHA